MKERRMMTTTTTYWPRMNHVTMSLLLVSMVTALTTLTNVDAFETTVPMDKGNNKCGNVFVLGPSQDVRLTGSGFVPDGYCGITVYAPPEVGNYTCDAICVTFKTVTWSTCEVKMKFVGHKFREQGDVVREYNCHSRDKSSFCMDVSSLRVEVIEDYVYAYETKRPLYEFDIDANARCTKDSIARKAYHASKKDLEEDEMQTYIEGIAVGVSLACVFLIVLFVAWCYTKHQAVTGGPSSETARRNSRKKGSIMSSVRAKLHTKKKSDASEADVPRETYRKTEAAYVPPTPKPKTNLDDPEAATELSPLTSSKEASAETYELTQETPIIEEKQQEQKQEPEPETQIESSKDGGQDSPKDGGDDGAQPNNLEPVKLEPDGEHKDKSLEDSPV